MITDADRIAFLLGVPVEVHYDTYEEVAQLRPNGTVRITGRHLGSEGYTHYDCEFRDLQALRRASRFPLWRGLAELLPPEEKEPA